MTTEKDKARVSDNELIAQFMGIRYGQNADRNGYLKYNISWDHLMLVVEKIESFSQVRYFTITTENSYITWDEGPGYPDGLSKFYGYGDSKIQRVYQTVVEFIKWHNEQR